MEIDPGKEFSTEFKSVFPFERYLCIEAEIEMVLIIHRSEMR